MCSEHAVAKILTDYGSFHLCTRCVLSAHMPFYRIVWFPRAVAERADLRCECENIAHDSQVQS